MTDRAVDIIVRRLRRELASVSSVALGSGLPQRMRPFLAAGIKIFPIIENGSQGPVDLAVSEALEISDRGDLVLPLESRPVSARRWIVATPHTHPDGEAKLVRKCRRQVTCPGLVSLVITELGVIEVCASGLVLREVAPGVATDDVKMRTRASLHVADDIRLMEL